MDKAYLIFFRAMLLDAHSVIRKYASGEAINPDEAINFLEKYKPMGIEMLLDELERVKKKK